MESKVGSSFFLAARHDLRGVYLGGDVVYVGDVEVNFFRGCDHTVGEGYGGDVLVEGIHFLAKHGASGTS